MVVFYSHRHRRVTGIAVITIWNYFGHIQKTETPELVPEDVDPIWSTGTEKIVSSGKGIMQRIISITTGFYDLLCDPRCGPFLLLGALMSFGGVWMRRSQATNLNESQTKEKSSTVVSWCKNSVFSVLPNKILVSTVFNIYNNIFCRRHHIL